ncbi:hypothetical protein Tco_0079808 [Tanacetum coccineum]
MPPKRTSTSASPAMTQATIKKLVADSVSAALEAQARIMAAVNLSTSMVRKEHFDLIRWFERTESVFSRSNVRENKGGQFGYWTQTDDAYSPGGMSYAQIWNRYSQYDHLDREKLVNLIGKVKQKITRGLEKAQRMIQSCIGFT